MSRRGLISRAKPSYAFINTAQFRRLKVAAATGLFTLTGQEAAFLRSAGFMTASPGSFALSGQAATFIRSLIFVAEAGSFSLAGQAAVVGRHFALSAQQGGFLLSGTDAAFVRALSLAADTGSFALAGQNAGLAAALVLSLEAGAFDLAGQDAGGVLGSALVAGDGSFDLTGQDASFAHLRAILADGGSFALVGQSSSLLRAAVMGAAVGAFALSGQAAALNYAHSIGGAAGSFALSGQAATLTYTQPGEAGGFSYVNTYTPASNTDTPGAFTISLGTDAGASSRHIIVAVQARDSALEDTAVTLTATLDGVSMTLAGTIGVVGQNDKSAQRTGIAALFIIEKSTSDTTGSLQVSLGSTFSGTMDSWRVMVFRAIKLTSATPLADNTGTSSVAPTALPGSNSVTVAVFGDEDVLPDASPTGTNVTVPVASQGVAYRLGSSGTLSGTISASGAGVARSSNWSWDT